MAIPPVPLTPDDNPQTSMQLSENPPLRQPYEITAIMIGLLFLLFLRARMNPSPAFFLFTLTGTVAAYLLLLSWRPKLPLHALAVVAAELGFLYSLPAVMLYLPSVMTRLQIAELIWCVISTGILGLLLGYWLKVDEHPGYVLVFNFLLTFILVGGYFTFH